ncbi:MarR family transcriptional regulator [Roseovarius salis]|uniref:MarR family winged helix-turn-helix transcriptional regulator n=1 Tax=Roseovarius salis TaxID=3376063 RepID=UPI0037C5ECD3
MSRPDAPPASTDQLAELLVHIGRSARGEDTGGAAPLTAAQWTALRFFARANRASRTPSAFASFQATTRGTASQTIKTLESRGLLERRRAEHDRRSVRFEVTGDGHALLARDPLRHLTAAIARLDEAGRAALARLLPELAADLARERGTSAIGTCENCHHYEDRGQGGYCACVAMNLAPFEIGQLCVRYTPEPGTPPKAANGG